MNKKQLDYFLKIRVPLIMFVVISAFVITFYAGRAERDGIGYAPEQPIAFSHKLHAGDMKIDCQYCHTGPSKGRHALVPSVNICMNCHTLAKKDQPEIIKLTQFYNENKPIPWKRIHKVPEYAYFNHSVHVNTGIECQTCHGNVNELEVLKQARGWTMTACLDCHRDPKSQLPYLSQVKQGPTHCAACHR